MKKILLLVCIIFIVINFGSCSRTKTVEPNIVSQNFLQDLYTVDEETVKDFSNMSNISNNTSADSALQTVNNLTKEIYQKFDSFITSKGYEDLMKNRIYNKYLQCAYANNCTLQCGKISLISGETQNEYRDYNYSADINIVFNDNKNNQLEKEKGFISIVKENGIWKINSIQVTTPSKFLELN